MRQLASFPRRRYTDAATPIVRLERLTGKLGGPQIYMKRDDLLGLAGGGNKTRKLEFLVADALTQGADTLITCGAVQSNHCRLTLAAANVEGLKCRLVLEERVPGSYRADASGNNLLFALLGVEQIKVVPAGTDMLAAMEEEAAEVRSLGRSAYVIPTGGSVPRGALGYVACADEILTQSFEQGLVFDALVCPSGSAGTHAGLLAGLQRSRADLPVIGVSVNRSAEAQSALVANITEETLRLMGSDDPVDADAVEVLDQYVGAGYSLPTDEMVQAVQLLAREEGILLDPVYTGKTMAGLVDQIRQGRFSQSDKVLFLHTGGSPSLYAYQSVITAAVPPRS